MSDKKISQLPGSTTPLAGTEELPVVQSGDTKKVTVANLTAGRAVSMGDLTYTGTLTGSTGVLNIGSGQIYKDASGNVGVGTSSPTSKLDVLGGNGNQLRLNNAGERFTQIDFANNGTPKGRVWLDNTDSLMVLQGGTGVGTAIYTNGSSEAMRIDFSGNVGIGTSSPVSRLTVAGSESATLANQTSTYALSVNAPDSTFAIRNESTTTDSYAALEFWTTNSAGSINIAYIASPSTGTNKSGTLVFGRRSGDNSAEALRIDSSGNVGIGTSSPAFRLDVADGKGRIIPSGGSANVQDQGSGTLDVYGATSSITARTGTIRLESYSDMAANVGTGIAFSSRYVTAPNNGSWVNAKIGGYKETSTSGSPRGYLALATTDNAGNLLERMRINSSGNVGIGTSAPSAKLGIESTDSTQLELKRIGTAGQIAAMIFKDGGDAENRIYSSASNLVFQYGVSNTEAMRIDSSGNLLVGTTTAGASKLVVNDNSIQINTAKTPASASDTGTTGQVAWDANYVYVCVATDTWKRAAISTW